MGAATVTVALAALLAVALLGSLAFGAEVLPVARVVDAVLQDRPGPVSTIVWDLRMPRSLLAAIVGAGLALAGTGVQTLVRNPLADPYLLGVSSGASVGATAVITTGVLGALGTWALFTGALLGALVAGVLVGAIAVAQGGITPIRLILTGTVLGSAFSATASFLVFRAGDPAAAQSVLFWLLGSLSGAQWDRVAVPAVTVGLVLVLFLASSGWLDALNAGPDTAAALGVPVTAARAALFAVCATAVGVLVAVSGAVGFVGLVVPHLARLLVGSRHRVLVPVSALAGALFLVVVDVAARIAVRPTEMPLSVVTGLIGAPVFLVLMGRRRYRTAGSTA
ncbi:FecCD family ABC transporter permease [Pseudonocardia sp. HH130629-09]|uniref:FecCD family ABC transporter permease n=1 Tax=Pseudonocardia sp. HH130629-09 TaxID=1641402 RepID=UPI0006CB6571|nr:iron ABC transporter permease [Pseudonocardia sp. HH130629-09]ALE83429.1 sugar ABC transporter substrate-binding protein [Pseudonocardia sp. HH130629-09]